MKHMGWEKAPRPKKTGGEGGDQSVFLKLEAGNTYLLRLVGRPVGYLQHWEPIICRSPANDPTTNQVRDPLILKGYEPKDRYAIWVLNRNDNNALKIIDFPGMLLDQFVKWKEAAKDEPGGQKGTDWSIELAIPQGGTKRQMKYNAISLDRTPFTPPEQELFKKMGGAEGLRQKLAEYRRDDTPEEINAKLAKLAGGGAKPSGGGGAKPQPQPQQSQPKPQTAQQQYQPPPSDEGTSEESGAGDGSDPSLGF